MSSDPSYKDGNDRFTRVFWKAFNDPVWIRYQCFCLLKLFIWFDGCKARALPSLNGGLLEIALTVPLNKEWTVCLHLLTLMDSLKSKHDYWLFALNSN